MDSTRFDRIIKSFAEEPSRRELLRLLGVSAFGAAGLSLLGAAETEAKKRRKRKKRKKKNKDKCKGKCGGSCPRCPAGSSCTDRDECTTALCDEGICTSPVDGDDCGLDTDGDTCFARDAVEGDRFCSRKLCNFIAGGSCDQCTGEEICAPAGGDDIECCLPCGAPL